MGVRGVSATLERRHDFVDKKLQGLFLAGHIQAITCVVDEMIDSESRICMKFVDDDVGCAEHQISLKLITIELAPSGKLFQINVFWEAIFNISQILEQIFKTS